MIDALPIFPMRTFLVDTGPTNISQHVSSQYPSQVLDLRRKHFGGGEGSEESIIRTAVEQKIESGHAVWLAAHCNIRPQRGNTREKGCAYQSKPVSGCVYVDSVDGPIAKKTQREVERQTRGDTHAERSAPSIP